MPATSLPFVLPPTARHLAPTEAALTPALRARGREVWPITRRGADLGCAVPLERRMPTMAAMRDRWRTAEGVFLPDILRRTLPRYQKAIASSLQMFERLRRGGRLLDEIDQRLRGDDTFRYAGSLVDKVDSREIERVFVDADLEGEAVAQDLWAMLAWLAHDDRDVSLRIRFSFGKDKMEEWLQGGDHIAEWSDAFARACFPECGVSDDCVALHALLGELVGRSHRLSERIVYNNAPDGGAVFHHDAEIGQLGVVFHQLQGTTGWLALGKRRLAALMAKNGVVRNEHDGMRALDDGENEKVNHLLNRDASFMAELAARGALFVLQAGDCILLPSHGIDDCTWHSVFGIGDRPSLAHSYGIFPRDMARPAGRR